MGNLRTAYLLKFYQSGARKSTLPGIEKGYRAKKILYHAAAAQFLLRQIIAGRDKRIKSQTFTVKMSKKGERY